MPDSLLGWVDNNDMGDMGEALLGAIGEGIPWMDIGSGYFNPRGFSAIADALERVSDVRLLLGSEPNIGAFEQVQTKRLLQAIKTFSGMPSNCFSAPSTAWWNPVITPP